MPIDLSSFRFGAPDTGGRAFDVPRGLDSKAALLAAMASEMSFPSWFGHNWDALSDCLRDLSWVDQIDVSIVHGDVPALADDELSVYLDILADAAIQARPEHLLTVVFPPEAREYVQRIAQS